ncbi:uncharacterized protein LOC131146705 [Malania oleifera]|uniref:uncharacterized protein LOC131146705 n=1 Tax=Malania oleifera TaxID=397392 RepID=UPI0025AE7649|nr:uncharacterized protein LOC131146705 [Malania oleifera]XP_057952443.1 uncharacterized protein LOC131146705 [Malania oleifera]XP_057952444.1 uncharacterized protein LOC131146705 [Malania oleifera]
MDVQTPNSTNEPQSPNSQVRVSVQSINLVIAGWILEFILRQPLEDSVMKAFLAVLPVSDRNPRLKKTLLLRSIKSETSKGSISEKLLNYLEFIEELDHTEGVVISESMKDAYCAVAVDCTVKCLEGKVDNRGKYFEAVLRIWKERICDLEKSGANDLVSEQLRTWRDEIEAAVWDTTVCKMILRMNTRNNALVLLEVYLTEAWEQMGPCFLELAAADKLNEATVDGEMQRPDKDPIGDQIEQKAVGSSISGHNVGIPNEESPDAAQDVGTSDVDKESHMRDELSKRKRVTSGGRCTRRALSGKSRGIKINDTEELGAETLPEKYDCLSSAEVSRMQAALKSSSLDLQAVVKDPLPDAVNFANTIAHEMARKRLNQVPLLENQHKSNADALAHVVDASVKAVQLSEGSSGNVHVEAAERNESNPTNEDAQGNEGSPKNLGVKAAHANEDNPGNQCCGHENDVPRPSLMVRNSTARTYEWDDSVDGSPDRLRLPSPRKMDVSPLKKKELVKIVRRRQIKRWSLLEEDTLRTAVQKYGKGNWKLILGMYPDVFEERTEVDLKDKWRNMVR